MLASELVTAVRRQGKIPADLLDADILAMSDLEIQGAFIPLVRSTHQEYFVTETLLTSYNGRVSLPPRCIAATIRHVQSVFGGVTYRLPQLNLEDDLLGVSVANPQGWYFDGAGLVLLPRGTNGQVRVRYFLRPSKLAVETDATKFRAITTATQLNGGWFLNLSGAAPAGTIDVVSAAPAHEFVAIDVTSSGGTTQTVAASESLGGFAGTVAVGYVCAAGYTPFIQIPEELCSALVHRVAAVILRSLGYDGEATVQGALADKAMAQGAELLAPRSEGNPRRLVGGIRRGLAMRWFR